jgi:hypothetical protein
VGVGRDSGTEIGYHRTPWFKQWLAARRLDQPANDWSPVVATDKAGRVYAGWTPTTKGNFDVVVRRWEKGAWAP